LHEDIQRIYSIVLIRGWGRVGTVQGNGMMGWDKIREYGYGMGMARQRDGEAAVRPLFLSYPSPS